MKTKKENYMNISLKCTDIYGQHYVATDMEKNTFINSK